MFALPDKWVWDFWFAEDGGDHQLLYLQAPRALGDPELRHHHATIGHAVSADFASWQLLPDALAPGDPGSWDDLAVWTGSAITHAGAWSMLYTGVSRSEGGLGQRIGLATSTDLLHWEKHPDNPRARSRSPLLRAARSGSLARPVLARSVALPPRG